MYQDQKSDRRQRTVKRGMFLRLRLLYRDVCKILKLQRSGLRQGCAVCRTPHRSGYALYRIYELQGKTGAEGRRFRFRYFRRTGLFRYQNALFKVIKVSDASELGSQIVVQGGTFYNDAVLRSFEKIAGCEAIRPDIAGIMGAFGAALIAREHYTDGYQTSMLSIDAINSLEFDTSMAKCKGCTNNCRLTINRFSGGRQYISGNRCERGLGKQKNPNQVPNLFDYKLKRLFSYEPLTADQAPRGPVGIPRVLNMYENYPFWFTFLQNWAIRSSCPPLPTTTFIHWASNPFPANPNVTRQSLPTVM